MRKLYEIDADIEHTIETAMDPETGEIVDSEALDNLFVERDQKIENVVLYCKDVNAEIAAVTHEIMVLQARVDKLENTNKGLKAYLSNALGGEKFKTSRCEVTYRRSEAVEVDDNFVEWASDINNLAIEFITHKETNTANKKAIKDYLKAGGTLEHCRIVEKQNMTIK